MTNPRTPAEALRWAAWLTLERGATYAQEAITPPMPPMDACTAYEYALRCEDRADSLEDAGVALLAEAERLEALEAKAAECARCEHSASDHVDGHGCTARLEDRSECECGPFVPHAEAKAAELTEEEQHDALFDARAPSAFETLQKLHANGFIITREVPRG